MQYETGRLPALYCVRMLSVTERSCHFNEPGFTIKATQFLTDCRIVFCQSPLDCLAGLVDPPSIDHERRGYDVLIDFPDVMKIRGDDALLECQRRPCHAHFVL